MNCRRARAVLPLYVGGDLPIPDRDLEAHLALCPGCRREWEVLSGLRKALVAAGLGPAPVSDRAFLDGVHARLREGVRPALPAPGRFGLRALRALAAAAVVAAMVGAVLWTAPGRSIPPHAKSVPVPVEVGADSHDEVPVLPRLPADAPVAFDLQGAGLIDAGGQYIAEAEIVPDPKRENRGDAPDFPLFEMKPIDEAEICADF